MSERDPRVTPAKGDVLYKENFVRWTIFNREVVRTVTNVYESKLIWCSQNGKPRLTTKEAWREWAASATVVRRGEG